MNLQKLHLEHVGKIVHAQDVKVAKDAVAAVRAVQEIFLLANLQMHEKGGDNQCHLVKTLSRCIPIRQR